MIACPVCQFRNPDSNVRCFRCSALLKHDDEAMREADQRARKKSRKLRLRNPLAKPIDWLRHRPWVVKMNEVPDDDRFRYPYTAGLLSLVGGAGHWYAGQPTKGAVLFLAWMLLIIFGLMTIREPWSNYVLGCLLAFYLFVWADSIAVAEKSNGNNWIFRKTLALVFGAMMILGVSVYLVQYLGSGFVTWQKVTSDAMKPAFSDGDRVVFISVPLWFRDPKPGEVVMYDPPRFSAESGKNVYSIDIRKYFQRVLAGPGDHIEKRGEFFYRNGELVKPEQEPFNGRVLPDFELVVPEDSFFIPVTNIPSDMMAVMMGGGGIHYVGQPGFVFMGWPQFGLVSSDMISEKGIAVVDPPEHRRWLE